MSEEYRYPTEQYLLIGKVGKPHGLTGEVKIVSFSGLPDNIGQYGEIVLVDESGRLSRPLAIDSCRPQGNCAIVRLAGLTSREEMEELENLGVLVARDRLPPPAAGEFYYHQYEGKQVVDLSGRVIGRVKTLFSSGAQDIMVIASGNEELLVPVVKEIVVGETENNLIIDPPPGLLEINSGGAS
jgi:16S rRNA processing protein RimM